jgi:cytoskeleton protein RodZ
MKMMNGGLFLAHVQDNDTQALFAGDSFEQIGSALEEARRAKSLKISDVSEHLRISVEYLSKLELGAFDELPAPAYVSGFLRSYGQFVGLDPATLVGRYTALTTESAAMPTYKIPVGGRPPQRSAPAIASMLVVCAGIAYGGWYWVNAGDVNDQMAMVPNEIVATRSVPAAMQDTSIDQGTLSSVPVEGLVKNQDLTLPAQPEKVITAEAVIPTPSVATADQAVMTNTLTTKTITTEAPATVAPAHPFEMAATIVLPRKPDAPPANANGPLLSGDLAEIQVITPASQDGKMRVAGNSATANLRVPAQEITIRAVAASWVEIVRDNGEEVMAKLMQVGDSYVVEGNTRLYLSTGNAGGLEIVIGNDDPRPIGETGQIVRDLPLVTDKLRQTF